MADKLQCPWTREQVRQFVRGARKPWGIAWDKLSTEMQENAIAAECLSVIGGQHQAIEPAAINALHAAMLAEAGLR